jgi:hypothetical protein
MTKKFSWSYSKLKSYEICPRRYHETDVKKAWPQERSQLLDYGDAVHLAMATSLKDGGPLPVMHRLHQHWIDKINNTPGELLVEDEAKMACTRDLQPTTYFNNRVWLRTVADAVKLNDDVALIVDFKAGKSLNVDPVQGVLNSLMLFIHFPKLKAVRFDFLWLTEDEQTTQVLYRNEVADQWAQIMPRVRLLEQAAADENFPPKPNRFCAKWCPVRSCEYWGK